MIVRILGEGQFDVADERIAGLNQHDEALVEAVEAGDETAFQAHLGALLGAVRAVGRALPDDHLGPSDLVLPPSDATIGDVRGLLADEGLIPG